VSCPCVHCLCVSGAHRRPPEAKKTQCATAHNPRQGWDDSPGRWVNPPQPALSFASSPSPSSTWRSAVHLINQPRRLQALGGELRAQKLLLRNATWNLLDEAGLSIYDCGLVTLSLLS
jgi:hypothetical protein